MRLTKQGFYRFLGILGVELRGDYQKGAVDSLFSSEPYVVLQGPRQSFKSFISSLYCAFLLLNGKNVVITAESMTQAVRSIGDEIEDWLISFLNKPEISSSVDLSWGKRNQREKTLTSSDGTWSKLYVASSQSTTSQGIKSIDAVVVDEAQDVPYEVASSIINPFVAEPRARGEEPKIIALGIGAPMGSYLRKVKQMNNSSVHRVDCHQVASEFPGYQENIEDAKQTFSDDAFAQHFLVKDVNHQEGKLLPNLIKFQSPHDSLELFEEYQGEIYWGIDLGQRDSTCVVVVGFHEKGHVDILDGLEMNQSTHGTNWITYAEEIASFIDKFQYLPQNIIIEGNYNDAVRDTLNEQLETGRHDIRETEFLSGEKKTKLLRQLKFYHDKDQLRINTSFDTYDQAYHDLNQTTYEYSGKRMKVSHSDWLSALLMSIVPRSSVEVAVV